ncbi:hypothetical protein HDU93_003119, partial [Gonapodya sp. JEL0774]
VFYPLPLVPQDDLPTVSARRVVRALRGEINTLRTQVAERDDEVASLRRENDLLRRQLNALRQQQLSAQVPVPSTAPNQQRAFGSEIDVLQRDIAADDGHNLSAHLSRLEDVMRALL